jgi:hypothetical protein
MLWRGHAIQGRCQPGRRAVLEETKEPSDRRYSTPGGSFSQGNFHSQQSINGCVCYKLQAACGLPDPQFLMMRFVWIPRRFLCDFSCLIAVNLPTN